MKLFRIITEIFGWIQIVASPTLTALIVAFFFYKYKPDQTGLYISIAISLTGLITGIILATRIWKKKGTINFISRISETPELENDKDEK